MQEQIRKAIENDILLHLSNSGCWNVAVGDKEVEFRPQRDGTIAISDRNGKQEYKYCVRLLAE